MNEQHYEPTIQLPAGASTLSALVDSLYYEIYWISVVFFVGIVGCMVVFAVMFRRRPGVRAKPPGHHNALELFWTFSPLLLLAYMFHQGFEGFMYMSVPPPNSINIHVTAYKWRWEFEQPNGMREAELMVPVNQPIRLILGSSTNPPAGACTSDSDCSGAVCEDGRCQDVAVLHSFFVPEFRVKRDVVPGMFSSMWFEATREGDYHVFCTEYCGTGHSRMLSRVHVVSREAYDEYILHGPRCPDEHHEDWQWGQALFSSYGCTACHNVVPSQGVLVGPNLANVVGTQQPLEGGAGVMADEAYIRRSLQTPQSDTVRGFGTAAAMPRFDTMPQSHANALLAFLAHLSDHGDAIQVERQCGVQGQ